MDVDSDNELLTKAAAGGSIERGDWPDLRTDLLARLDKIARGEFPIPKLPPPRPRTPPKFDAQGCLVSPHSDATPPATSPHLSSSQEANKENAPSADESASKEAGADAAPSTTAGEEQQEEQEDQGQRQQQQQQLGPGQLPQQIEEMLTGINEHVGNFHAHPPHTIQRLAELILRPRAHYKALAPYLHAVDRVVSVTSGADIYPLPPPDVGMEDGEDPASSVAWSNPTQATLGTDEALGGALLTPIPWVAANKTALETTGGGPGTGAAASTSAASSTTNSSASGEQGSGVQIHSESSETIDGPNGMGRIETVSVSVNGVHSTGHTRAITQGELLRQEQRAGVVPVSQLNRSHEAGSEEGRRAAEESQEDGERGENEASASGEEDAHTEDEQPHARGPNEIGVGDTGLQSATTSFIGEGGLGTGGIDVEAAVGRKHEDEEGMPDVDTNDGEAKQGDEMDSTPSPTDSAGVKREAEIGLEKETSKKIKEDGDATNEEPKTAAPEDKASEEAKDASDADKMETDK